MKKIYESRPCGWDESCEIVHIYELDNEDEFWEFEESTREERREMLDVCEEYNVMPGAKYHRYEIELSSNHIVMYETIALNV